MAVLATSIARVLSETEDRVASSVVESAPPLDLHETTSLSTSMSGQRRSG
jgi:hypothetical protein